MAEYKIIEASGPDPEGVTRSTIRVEFEDQRFDQPIVTTNKGAALSAQLKDYAEDYERQWVALVAKALLGLGGATGAALIALFLHSPALVERGFSALLVAMLAILPGGSF